MSHNINLFPVNQLLEWFEIIDKKFINLKGDERMIILGLAKFCDKKWRCFPSLSKIANLVGKDKKHVEDVISRLIEKKILKKKIRFTKDGDRDSNEYTIIVDNLWRVGANSPLRWGQIYPYGRGKSTPVTIHITNQLTNKPRAMRTKESRANQKQVYADVESQSTSFKSDDTPKQVTQFGLEHLEKSLKIVGKKSKYH